MLKSSEFGQDENILMFSYSVVNGKEDSCPLGQFGDKQTIKGSSVSINHFLKLIRMGMPEVTFQLDENVSTIKWLQKDLYEKSHKQPIQHERLLISSNVLCAREGAHPKYFTKGDLAILKISGNSSLNIEL